MVQTPAAAANKTFMDRVLDGVETLGNKVPHPVMMFVYPTVFVILLSTLLQVLGVNVSEQVLEPVAVPVEHNFYPDTTEIQLDAPREVLEWSNTDFQVREETIPVTFIAMMGAGLAESAGLMGALIRKLSSLHLAE